MKDFVVVIPARYASTRLAGKPLLEIAGKPMIRHVWERGCESGAARVIIATDDARIESACSAFGAEVVMTSAQHESGTDRLEEAVTQLALPDDAVIVNVQGDEPLMPPENIRQVAKLVMEPNSDIATLCVPVESLEEFRNPNVVKAVMSNSGRALYFSRATIPFNRDDGNILPGNAYRHIGIYAYRRQSLHRFSMLPPAAEERMERLEQLRALANDMVIRMAVAVKIPATGVDTVEDLERMQRLMSGDVK